MAKEKMVMFSVYWPSGIVKKLDNIKEKKRSSRSKELLMLFLKEIGES